MVERFLRLGGFGGLGASQVYSRTNSSKILELTFFIIKNFRKTLYCFLISSLSFIKIVLLEIFHYFIFRNFNFSSEAERQTIQTKLIPQKLFIFHL